MLGMGTGVRFFGELSLSLYKGLETIILDKEFYFSVLKNIRHDIGLPFYSNSDEDASLSGMYV